MKRILFTVCMAFTGASAHAGASVHTVADIEAMLAKPAVMCGRFDQLKHLKGMKKPLASHGRFCVVAGKGVLWRTLKPFPNTLRLTANEIVHFQGERVAMRIDAQQEPTVRIINQVLFSMLAGELGQLDTLFKVDASLKQGSWKVDLTARQAGLAKVIGAISLDGAAHVRNIHMTEAGGDRSAIAFSDIQTGADAITAAEAALF